MKEKEIYERSATIERKGTNGESTYSVSLSSEYPVKRWGVTEILEHSEAAVNMERARNGMILLFNHDENQPIGRINNLSIRADKKLAGDLVFSETETGKLRKQQVDEGTLTDISIRYSIEKFKRNENKETGEVTLTATRWTPQEGSIVSVPADPSVGVGRNLNYDKEEKPMSESNGENNRGGEGVVVDFENGRKSGVQEGAKTERKRVSEINLMFDAPGFTGGSFDGLRKTLIDNGSSVDACRQALLAMAGGNPDQSEAIGGQPAHDTQQRTNIQHGRDESDKNFEAMRKATEFKAGIIDTGTTMEIARSDIYQNPYGGLTLGEMARESLRSDGHDVRGLSTYDVVGYALNPNAMPSSRRSFVGQGTGNFAALVENIASKSMMKGFQEAPETWRDIVRIGQVSSFRQESRVDLSEFSDLDTVAENGEYKHGEMTDNREYIQASKYGKLFAITREVIVNDDLNALNRIPMEMGRSAQRKIGDLVYAILTTPALLRDAVSIFDAARNNIITSGGAPSITQLDAMRVLMAKQSGMNSKATAQNIRMSTLIVPIALETTALILSKSVNDPDQIATLKGGGGTSPNPFQGIKVVADARLDAASDQIYYGSAYPGMHDTIEVAFLNGNQMPSLESRDGWTVDGIEYKTRLECGVAALGYKALVRNAG